MPALVDSESDSDEEDEVEVLQTAFIPVFTPVNSLYVNDILVTPGLVYTFQPNTAGNSWRVRLLVLVCSAVSKRSASERTFFLACFFFIVLFFVLILRFDHVG